MWIWFRKVHWASAGMQNYASEVLENTTRTIIIAVGLIFGVCCLGINLARSGIIPLLLIPVGVTWLVVIPVVLRLLNRQVLAAQTIWLVGYLGMVTAAMLILHSPLVGLLYILAPLCAVLLTGWPTALLAGGLAPVFFMLAANGNPPGELASLYLPLLIFGEILVGFIGLVVVTCVFSQAYPRW